MKNKLLRAETVPISHVVFAYRTQFTAALLRKTASYADVVLHGQI
jgi:hypothetical protein